MIDPPQVTGTGKLFTLLRQFREFMMSNRIIDGADYAVEGHGLRGVSLKFKKGAGGGGTSNFASRYWVTGVANKYVTAVPWAIRADYETSDVVAIARPRGLRNEPAGISGSYRYDGQQGVRYKRLAANVADGFIEIKETLDPGYGSQQTIYAYKPRGGVYADTDSQTTEIPLTDASGNEILLLDVNSEGNHWRAEYNPFEMCINKELYTAIFSAGTPEKLTS